MSFLIKIKIVFAIFLLLVFALFVGLIKVSMRSSKQKDILRKEEIIPRNMVSKKTQVFVKAAIPYWDQENALLSFREHIDYIDYINLFWYYVEEVGTIATYQYAKEDKEIIDFAHKHSVKVFAVITNLPEQGSWDSRRVELVIKDRSSREKHIENIVTKLELFGFDGVDIDYEEVEASEKEDFSLFIKELSNTLHKRGKIVAVALHPKTIHSQKGNGEFQDWKKISDYADHLNIMAYGEHWDESEAGPIASIGWVKSILEYAKGLTISPEKFFLGIPLYGYDWNKDDGEVAEGLTYIDVQSLLRKYNAKEYWDESPKSPSFFYTRNGEKHEVWFENAESIKEKILLADGAGLGGVSFWRLGREDSRIWSMLEKFR